MQSLKLDFKEIAFIDKNEGFISEFHIHNWFDVSFVLKGSLTYEIDNKVYVVNEGDVVVVGPGKAHREISDSDKHLKCYLYVLTLQRMVLYAILLNSLAFLRLHI